MIYNHKLINDLAWALGSPSLLDETTYHDRRLLSSEWGQIQLSSNLQLLSDQDKSPQHIQAYFSEKSGFKLGHYFEDLIAYWFIINPHYEILSKNLIISENKITLGEIDFIIRDLNQEKNIHLEVAVKFYLKVEHNNQSYWFGPNLHDRLDLKLEKTLNKQITFSETDIAQKQLSGLNIVVDEHMVLLKGRLFCYSKNLTDDLCWLSESDFKALKSDSNWIILNKTHWLSEVNNIDYNFLPSEVLSKQDLNELLNSGELALPVCVVRIDNNKETNRLFITSDFWHEDAIATL